MDKIYDFESALAGQTKVMSNLNKIALMEGQPRDVEVVFMMPLMRGGNPQGAGNVGIKALSLDARRCHV